VTNHVVIPVIFFVIMIISGYLMQLFSPIPYLPSAIPEYISEIPHENQMVLLSFIVLYAVGLLALIILRYVFKYKDYL